MSNAPANSQSVSVAPNREPVPNAFRKFIGLAIAYFLSALGTGISSFGIGVYVFSLTGKATASALITLTAFLPGLLLTPIAGILADRYNRRVLYMIGDSASALGLFYILWHLKTGTATFTGFAIGVAISSIFSALTEPAFKATISDLLDESDYSRANGILQLAGSAKFLIAPIVAGFLFARTSLETLLILDVLTIIPTILITLEIRKSIPSHSVSAEKSSLLSEFRDGANVIFHDRAMTMLMISATAMTFFIGSIQILNGPLILSFADSETLGTVTTIAATGMLVGSFILSVFKIHTRYADTLYGSLILAGVFMIGFALRENIVLITASGFLFFMMLPFANMSLDVLVRTRIDNEHQGRVWGLIGMISQLGYVFAYATLGFVADHVFTPLLNGSTVLADLLRILVGHGSGRGIALTVLVCGALLIGSSISFRRSEPICELNTVRTDKYETDGGVA